MVAAPEGDGYGDGVTTGDAVPVAEAVTVTVAAGCGLAPDDPHPAANAIVATTAITSTAAILIPILLVVAPGAIRPRDAVRSAQVRNMVSRKARSCSATTACLSSAGM